MEQLRPCIGRSERDIHKAVVDYWRSFGLPGTLVATIPNVPAFGQYGLTKGLFDLLAIAPGLPVGFIELKRDGGRPSPEQLSFQEILNGCGVKNAITYGRDEPIRVLEAWNVVRRATV